jgi:hypothetical protein
LAQDHPSLCAFLCSRLRDEIFSNTLALSPENFQRDAFYYKDTLDDTRNLHGFYFHIYTHTHHARCYRTRARPGCWVMREVRFRLSASKNFMKEKKMCLTHEFLDPFVSRVASECFFFFPLFLSLLLSLVVVDLDDDDDRRPRSNNAKDLRIGWSPARSSSRYRLCESAIFKEEEQERERKRSCLVSFPRRKKKIVLSFSPENVRFFRRVERSRERKRCLFL